MLDNNMLPNIVPLHPEHSSGLVYNMLIAQLLQLGNVLYFAQQHTHTTLLTLTASPEERENKRQQKRRKEEECSSLLFSVKQDLREQGDHDKRKRKPS